jgi:triacylglycerol lipase
VGTALFQGGDFFGFAGAVGGDTVLAFRGTDSIDNWLTDGQYAQVDDPSYPGKVHRGFAAAMAALWPALAPLLPAAGRVWVAGHSLGGALATLAAVRLLSAGYAVPAVYTFGSPRVGDLDFFHGYQALTYRVVNNDDIVTHVPTESMILPVKPFGLKMLTYKHVGTLKYLDRHGRLGEGTSDWDVKKELMMTALLRAGGTPWPRATEDHRISNYLAALATNLPA